jgi:poly(3-hydroxybutyrate) depolymerase
MTARIPRKLLRMCVVLAVIWTGCTANSCATNTNTPTTDRGRPPADTGQRRDQPTTDQQTDQRVPRLPDISYKGSFTKGSGHATATLDVAGYARKVELYAPAGLGAQRPLLVTFHGTNDDALKMITGQTQTKALADAEGLLVVSPWARHMKLGDWDNHTGSETYWETHPNTDPDKNADLLLLRAIIQEAHAVFGVDRRRVYLLGHSSGAFFAIAAGLAMQGTIAGFVSSAGGLVRCPTTGGCSFKGSGSSCSALAGQPGYCSCSGTEKPATVPQAQGGGVFGYISHASDDDAVSVYYACELATRMKARGHPATLAIRASDGHSIALGLAQKAWPALKQHALP